MKSLRDFLVESETPKEEAPTSKSFTIDYTGLDGADEQVKSFAGNDKVSVEGNAISFTIDKDNVDTYTDVIDKLKEFKKEIMDSSHRINNESYARLCKAFAKSVDSADSFAKSLKEPEEE